MDDPQHLAQANPRVDNVPNDTVYVQRTPEMIYRAQQEMYARYWRDNRLVMNHAEPPVLPLPQGPFHGSQEGQGNVLAAPYHDLPQREYVAKRRFQPKYPILFRTQTTGYIRLIEALQGTLQLLGPDDAVFSGDNLSQKQSIRLEIVSCPSYERQINVRNPANHGKSVTRAKLAEKIAKEIADYMKVPFLSTSY
ncbi:hypothetical protein L226DRAFT_566456 [Lentinus tigrinus ALCF2SS1-7]|uniref:Uncharacterized protein n=1 Tax=Lentinus tigrinus ALCF2SS1-6 TaxID=1328759 RepID=A0A5C2SQP4_9APHY|nr:hypothetical protein L227DRAFT_648773 [Lentinus tigrinus ALCF2SS1-6]RPD79907.1 hypothetical protein L226DRAFT_566456 [Lentinus tigrinus ALCF2SS1-7]